jgi:hypothetical protein
MENKKVYRIGVPCSWATPRPNGQPFWNRGKIIGYDVVHILFLRQDGVQVAELQSNVMRLVYEDIVGE